MNTKDKGSLSEAIVMASLLKKGYVVCVPWGDNCPYDLVIDMGNSKLKRVQVKTGRIRKGSMVFNLCSVYYNSEAGKSVCHKYTLGNTDYFAVYCPDNDKVYLLPEDALKSTQQCNLRVEPLDSHRNAAKVVWATQFEI